MFLQRTLKGYDVIVNGDVIRLKPAQAEQLVAMLIGEMPGIPDRLRMLWAMRSEPRARLVQRFKVIDERIIHTYRLEVYMPAAPTKVMFEGPEHALCLQALHIGWDAYGQDIEVAELVVDLVSQKVADRDLQRVKADTTVQKLYGMSLQKVAAYVTKYGRLPKEVTQSNSVS